MIVRIDTTNLTRGREFTLYAQNTNAVPITMKAVEVNSGLVADIVATHETLGDFDGYTGIAPQFDGYLLAKIATQKVVKKIGNPIPSFVIGYKAGYTVPYTAFGSGGIELGAGNLTYLGDGFYYTLLPQGTAVVKALDKNFIVNKNLLKMNYEITMEGGSLDSTYEALTFDNVALPNVELPNALLGEATLDAVLPNVTITEL